MDARVPSAGGRLAAAGDWLARHQGAVRTTQWCVVGIYLVLVVVPAFLPLPDKAAHLWSDLTLFAQFAFWGVWWPFVLLSMVLVGRAWCGYFCPEGALSEFASRRGAGRQLPRWITWGGWPFVGFVSTTLYGQLVSVYQYPKPALAILGGSTAAAVAVGLRYGRGKRVWCRYLCPVSGVFGLLAKLAPLHFRVDQAAWRRSQRAGLPVAPINCAPLVPFRTMQGTTGCHMCSRCSGFRDAVTLAARSPNAEIGGTSERPNPWDTALVLFGLMGVAVGAFHWSASPWFVDLKQAAAGWLVERDVLWPIAQSAPWWLLTNYPDHNDVLTLLDGSVLVAYVVTTAAVMGSGLAALLAAAVRAAGPWSWPRFHRLALTLVPLAGCGVFLGLSALSVTLLKGEGVALPRVDEIRAAMLAGAALWSVFLAWRVAGRDTRAARRLAATGIASLAVAFGVVPWALLFWGW